jgi:hypothetical protein
MTRSYEARFTEALTEALAGTGVEVEVSQGLGSLSLNGARAVIMVRAKNNDRRAAVTRDDVVDTLVTAASRLSRNALSYKPEHAAPARVLVDALRKAVR